MKKLLLPILLIVGCVHWQPTIWDFEMTLKEFQEKNDNLILMRMTADTIIYKRIEHYDNWNNRHRYYTYTFVDGDLAIIDIVARKPKPKKPQTQKIEVKIKKD